MKTKLLIIFFCLISSVLSLTAQTESDIIGVQDSIRPDTLDLLMQQNISNTDSLPFSSIDSSFSGSFANSNPSKVIYSQDSLDAPIDYNSKDSMDYDIKNEKIHLWGEAFVKYTDLTITADYIIFDWGNNEVTAMSTKDSLGNEKGKPKFEQGTQNFTSGKMRYNFDTEKGIIYDVVTKQGSDIYVHGAKAKFQRIPGDSSSHEDIVYSENAIFTTCTHDEPHFGIRSNKQKVIANKLIVVGPSNLEVSGVPTPLWLPFGFYPVTEGQSTGLLFPRNYEFSETQGFGLLGVGWYFPFGPHFDLSLTSDIYTRGSWRLHARSNYAKRYKHNGNFYISYANIRNENEFGFFQADPSFQITWRHSQDAKAHPTNTISGNVRFQTNGFRQTNENEAQARLENTTNSNVSFTHNPKDKPYSLSVFLSHSQVNSTNQIDMTLPNVSFKMNRMYPFKGLGKKKSSSEKWYEKISFKYDFDAKNQLSGTDTTFFSQETIDNARFGARHQVKTDLKFNLFKYFNVSPRFNFDEIWYFKTREIGFDPTTIQVFDTIVDPFIGDTVISLAETIYGETTETESFGFAPFHRWDAGVSISTKVFGTAQFKKGWLRGVRQTITPTLTYTYEPSYIDTSRNDYFRYHDTDSRPDFNDPERYSIFVNPIFATPSTTGQRKSLAFSVNNLFEAKLFSKKDSTTRNIKLNDRLSANMSYNFALDSFNLSDLSLSGNTRFFKGITNLTYSASFNPYTQGADGISDPTYLWETDNKLLRLTTANIGFRSSISVKKIRDLFGKNKNKREEDLEEDDIIPFEEVNEEERLSGVRRDPFADKDDDRPPIAKGEQKKVYGSFLDLFDKFSIAHDFKIQRRLVANSQRDTITFVHSLQVRGSFPLTDNWNVNLSNISYDFVNNRFVYPSVGFSRNLHCWLMEMNWFPSTGVYNFTLRVKPGSLDFLKIPSMRNNQDRR